MSTFSVRDAAEGDEPALARIFRRASLSNADDRDVLLAHPEALTLSDDVEVSIGAMPFPFEFFGQAVTGEAFVTSNGVVEFGTQAMWLTWL